MVESKAVKLNLNPWPESASELYRPSNRSLSVKLVPTLAYRECHVVSVTDPYGSNLDFLELMQSCFCTKLIKLCTIKIYGVVEVTVTARSKA
jgi:hypothetical protein